MEFDGDGKPDILSGCYSDHKPMAGLFWVLAGAGDGTVKKAETVKGTDGKPLIIPASEADIVKSICTQPAAHDWDGDGDMDILTGNFEGTYFLFTNDGSKEKAAFNPKPSQVMMSGGKPLHLKGHHSGICPVDWDGDGDADILTGSGRGGVYWAENKTSGKTVQFGDFQEILAPPAPADFEDSSVPPAESKLPTAPGDNTRAWAADVNGDGKLDILLGDSATVSSRAAGLTEKQFTEKQIAWQKEMETVQKAYQEAKDEDSRQKAMENLSAHYEKRSVHIKEDRTGFVWIMLRK